jgi:hypothetical protein
MSQDGESVEATGDLFGSHPLDAAFDSQIRRFPTLAVNRSGEIRLAYMAHDPGQTKATLEAVRVEVDPTSGTLQVPTGAERVIIARDCIAVPPIFSADGEAVYCVSARSGQLTKFLVDRGREVRGMIAMARQD